MKLRLSLKQAWLAMIVFVLFIPVMLGVVVYGTQQFKAKLTDSLKLEQARNAYLANAITAEVERLRSVLVNKSDPFSTMHNEKGELVISDESDHLMHQMMSREQSILEVMIISDNKVLTAIDIDLGIVSGINSSQEKLNEVAEHWGIGLSNSPPEISIPLAGKKHVGTPRKHGGHPTFSMSVPIGAPARGVLVAFIDINRLMAKHDALIKDFSTENVTNFLLDHRGLLISQISAGSQQVNDLMTHMPIVRSALIGEHWESSGPYLGVLNEEVYGTYTIVPSLGWVLVTEIIGSAIKDPILRGIYITIATILFILALAIWLAMVLANQATKLINDIRLSIQRFARDEDSEQLGSMCIVELDGIAVDLTQMMKTREKANKKLRLSNKVFQYTHEGILVTDLDLAIIDVNPALSDTTGYSREELIGQTPSILKSGKHDAEFYAQIWQKINDKGYWHGEVWNRKKNGELYAELLSISVLLDGQGKVQNYVGMSSDITDLKKQQEELKLMAHYDALTQLPNRILFADRFAQEVAHSRRTNTLVAVCFLDLDGFKPVNDQYGHAVGDHLLVQVAARLKKSIREEDTVSRQGGDEFTLLLGSLDSIEACKTMLQRLHASLCRPYLIDGQHITISVSSGVTMYPLDDVDLDTLVRHADQAMYEAKKRGGNQYQLFNAEQDKVYKSKLEALAEIQQAINNNEFCLHYQPKVNMATGEVYGVEALIRWIHPEKGLIPPLDFLPLVDGSELEIIIGDWVVDQALKQLSDWEEQGAGLEVSVNIASHHLLSTDFVSKLEKALSHYPNVKPNKLQLEILESSALSNLNVISEIIKACRDCLGVGVALDDFGTGYSSLTHLRNLQANIIKIDRSFIRDILDDPDDFSIVDGIIGLADAFDRELIAEGVETTAHGKMLLVMGCQNAQGYGIAKPMLANDILIWLKRYEPNQQWIQCASTQGTLGRSKLEQFSLVLEQWMKKYEAAIYSQEGELVCWPIMGKGNCHCAAWIRRSWKDGVFRNEWLLSLDEAHEAMCVVANEIMDTYNDGQADTAKKEMVKLEQSIKTLQEILRSGHH